MGDIIGFIFLIILLIFPIFMCILATIQTYKKKKSIERNASFYEFRDEVFESQCELCKSQRYVDDVKKDIDKIIAEMPYLTKQGKQQAEKSLEIIRNDLADYQETIHYPLETKARLLRDRLDAWEKILIAQGEKIY